MNNHPVILVKASGKHLVCSECGQQVRSISKKNATLLHASEWKR
jgi:hypothetical protein